MDFPSKFPDFREFELEKGSQQTTCTTMQSTETRRGRPACGKAYFRPVFRDREDGSCVYAYRSRLLGRFWGACLRRQKSRSRRRLGELLENAKTYQLFRQKAGEGRECEEGLRQTPAH